MSGFIDRLRRISKDAALSPAQKSRYLALEAEGQLPYPALDESTRQALDERVICDMYEGHAPYRPRYVLPDYGVVLGSTEVHAASSLRLVTGFVSVTVPASTSSMAGWSGPRIQQSARVE